MRLLNMKILLLSTVILLTSCGPSEYVEITTDEILDHIKTLSDDRYEGRRAGEIGDRKAARYIIRHFRAAGLDPMGDRPGSFRQQFDFISGVKVGRRNSLTFIYEDGSRNRLHSGKEFVPLGFSSSEEASGEIVFAGYGISSDTLGYLDYAEIDVAGKIVLLLRYSPDGTNPHGDFSRYSSLRYKVMKAREKGAVAVMIASGPADEEDENYLVKSGFGHRGASVGIPVVYLTMKSAIDIIEHAGKDLKEVQEQMNEQRESVTFTIPIFAEIETDVEKVPATSTNIVGGVEGTDPELKDEYIVVGAHYDHLGWGGDGAMIKDTVAIHNGADDNASGTAGLIELAEWFAVNPQPRSLIFVAFGAEELGLLGSATFADKPPVPRDQITAMVNMDMIGRMEDNEFVAGGAGTSSIWKDLVSEKASDFGLKPKFDNSGFGSSDHQSFYVKDIPVLFFFTGTHTDYHRPSDDWIWINAEGEVQIAKLIRDVLVDLGRRDERPDFVEVQQEQHGGRRGFAVSLGTIPDYAAADIEGMRISGARKGSPAHKAGMKGGDILVKLGDNEIKSIYDYMYALQEAKAGEPTEAVVLRGGQRITLEVIPARRRE
ncbi:MAG TPA: M28 family peptidase [Candidatus Marinimicrobia bacterium]|nr:M28 family peptidase [Candidatus Neomarinimicrobiota bacterium]